MRGYLFFGLMFIFGCTESVTPPPAPIAAPVAAIPIPTTAPAPQPVAVKIPHVVIPSDLGGKAVSQALVPSVDQGKLPVTATPKPRESELDSGEIPQKPVPIVLPMAGMPQAKPVRISPPKEKPPTDLGSRPTTMKIQTPYRPLVKAPSVMNPGASDVGPLVRVVPDKASTDDPTADVLSGQVIDTKFPLPTEPLPFVRFTIPDPFEYGGQLKGKLPRETEFAIAPSLVNPEKK
jgi:hypothetical protein